MTPRTSFRTFTCLALSLLIAGCGEEYHLLPHDKAMELSGISEGDYMKLRQGDILVGDTYAITDGHTVLKTWLTTEGLVQQQTLLGKDPESNVLSGIPESNCPEHLQFTRLEEGWLYELESGASRAFTEDELENCVVTGIQLLPIPGNTWDSDEPLQDESDFGGEDKTPESSSTWG